MHAASDIDLIVIAPEFDEGRPAELVDRLWKLTWRIDARLAPIACGEREWEEGSGRIILGIARRDGEPVAA